MPLSRDSEELNLFRQIPFEQKKSKDRQTRGQPMSIGDIGDAYLFKLSKKAGGERSIIAKNWGTIVPQNFLNKSRPERVHMGILYVRTENSAVKQELSFLKRPMLEKIKSFRLCKNIKEIRFL